MAGRPASVRNLRDYGGALTIGPGDPNFTTTNKTVVTSSRLMAPPIEGAGDPSSTTAGRVTTPPWLVLSHELCGHVLENPNAPSSHLQTEAGNRTAVDVENQIRREHDRGSRRGAFVDGGGAASVWHLQTGDDPALHKWISNVASETEGIY